MPRSSISGISSTSSLSAPFCTGSNLQHSVQPLQDLFVVLIVKFHQLERAFILRDLGAFIDGATHPQRQRVKQIHDAFAAIVNLLVSEIPQSILATSNVLSSCRISTQAWG